MTGSEAAAGPNLLEITAWPSGSFGSVTCAASSPSGASATSGGLFGADWERRQVQRYLEQQR